MRGKRQEQNSRRELRENTRRTIGYSPWTPSDNRESAGAVGKIGRRATLDFDSSGGRGLRRAFLHTVFQSANALADTFAQFRQLLGAEHQERDKEDHQQMHRLKQAFEHKKPPPPEAGSKPNSIESGYLRQLSRRPGRNRA